MKKYLQVIAISAIALPLITFAGYNDVTLTVSTILTVGSYTLTVSGTSAVVQSITVGASSLSIVLQPSSVIAVSSASGQVLATNAGESNITGNQCTGGVSTLTLSSSSGSAVTLTVTPGSATCVGTATNSTSTAGGGNGAPGSGGGGGGGGSYTYITPVSATTAVVTTPTQQPSPSVPAVPIVQTGSMPTYTFTRAIGVGASNADVKVLQQILNAASDTLVATVGAGSPGHETNYFGPATKKAIQKFQVKYKIASPGQPGYGTLGPKTRAKLNELSKRKV